MKPSRLFLYDDYKGTRDYLRVQGRYELARTILYFAVSLSLFIAGILATGDRMNLLTIVAVLGCLPACKSAIDAFMFLRYKGCSAEHADEIDAHMEGLNGLYDRIFTSYDRNFQVAHVTVKGNILCGYTQDPNFEERLFGEHISKLLKKDGFPDVSIKIYGDIRQYTARLEQLKTLNVQDPDGADILNTLKDVSL